MPTFLCPDCRSQVAVHAKVCAKCGYRLTEEEFETNEAKFEQSQKSSRLGCGFVLALVAVIGAWGCLASEEKSDDFASGVIAVSVVNPATVNVVVSVTNTGTETVAPTCTVTVGESPYNGWGSFEIDPIAPGATDRFRGEITVETEGAAYVTGGTSTCRER